MSKLDARRERRMTRKSLADMNVAGAARHPNRLEVSMTALLNRVRTMSDKTKVTITALRECYPNNAAVNDALDEISRVAAMLNLDVSRWNILKLFGRENPQPGECPIMTDPVTIEQIIREKCKKPADELTDSATVISDQLIETIAGLYASAAKAKITKQRDELEDAAAYNTRNVNDLLGNVWRTVAELSRISIQIATLNGQLDPNKKDSDRVRKQLEQLERAGFWTDFRVEKSCLWARTAKPVVVSEVNILAGIERHVNCGYYAVRIAPTNGTVAVYACGGNRLSENKGAYQIHPHVYADGKICLGPESSMRFIEAVKTMSIVGMLVAVQSALSGYDNGSTYVPLDQFEKSPTYASQVVRGYVSWGSPYESVLADDKNESKPKPPADSGKLAEPGYPAAGEGEAVRI